MDDGKHDDGSKDVTDQMTIEDDRDDGLNLSSLAVIGAGKMGETLISALLASEVVAASAITATAGHSARLQDLQHRFGIATAQDATAQDNVAAIAGAHLVLLAVKPQMASQVLAEIGDHLESDQILISIVAGLSTAEIERHLRADVPVVRAMPNTPARLGAGMTAVCGGQHAEEEHLELSQQIFARIGRSLILEEKHFDAVTGLSASGPAFIYIVIEAMAEGGVKMGLPRRVATELAAQTCLGAGRMVVETGDHPALLKDEVTTPAGCTIDGILKLEEGGLRVTLIKAIVEAGRRAGGLVDG